ncbi:glycosyltransferase family 4 protein [Cryobacterium roopkundense]|uniref:Glycosyl transferase family 1 domain-containing protein n=1 Tax=Cryobacterium roopkundense TaxID=1001240 RepID=A0A7W8ZZ07_9MICO|nr:glycosyltransferase family 4 protein [Cryobacterium roopkundense]MBB5642781.1 hypothetical protein [Cryobacterium roopkundense]
MRIGVLNPQPDPLTSRNWSGTPRGIADGLLAHDVEVVPLGTRLPQGLHQAVAVLSRIGGKRGAIADRTLVRQSSRTWALARSIRDARPLDAIVSMGNETFDLRRLAACGIPIVTYDDSTLQQMWQHPESDIRSSGFPDDEVLRWFSRQKASSLAATACCVSTDWAGRSYVKDYGVPPERVHVVGMGHRPRGIDLATERDWSVPRFLFVGVDWRRKNGDAVLRAFEEIRRRDPRATLDLVGNHPRVDQAGVAGHGFLSREIPAEQAVLDRLFATATAFVLPSRFEPAGIAYLEAASAGLPVVATSEGGAAEMLGRAAITVHPHDHRGLADALARLSVPETARSMGARASEVAASSRWDDVAGRILQVIDISAQAERPDGAQEPIAMKGPGQ